MLARRKIINRKGKMNGRSNCCCLYDAKDGQQYVVMRAPEVGLLRSLGIVENAVVQKKHTYRLGGPVLLQIDSCEIAIGKGFAEKIIVRG